MKLLELFDAQMERNLTHAPTSESTPAKILQPFDISVLAAYAACFFPELTNSNFWFIIDIEDGNIYEL